MSKGLSIEAAAWIEEQQGKHFCSCGCGQPIRITKSHWQFGITKFCRGHNLNAKKTDAAKLWDHVEKIEGGCWLWTGVTVGAGYGLMSAIEATGQKVLAHRFSWELANGPIPEGIEVCHDCPGGDNKRCVNPSHLWLGTHQDNMDDKTIKGQNADMKGEKNGNAILDEAKVRDIRGRRGEPTRLLAVEFGVSRDTIRDIWNGRSWKE